jgi:hypothetical protein
MTWRRSSSAGQPGSTREQPLVWRFGPSDRAGGQGRPCPITIRCRAAKPPRKDRHQRFGYDIWPETPPCAAACRWLIIDDRVRR